MEQKIMHPSLEARLTSLLQNNAELYRSTQDSRKRAEYDTASYATIASFEQVYAGVSQRLKQTYESAKQL